MLTGSHAKKQNILTNIELYTVFYICSFNDKKMIIFLTHCSLSYKRIKYTHSDGIFVKKSVPFTQRKYYTQFN